MEQFEAYTEKMSAEDFADQSYLNYAVYSIVDRAIPHLADGLKPVHRRILFAMSQLKLEHTAKYKKSARTVGDVLGKYHPHGDTACYEAMVLLAQDFKTRYPLIDGQGNWGSIDEPKSFAAMRYTEAKLTRFSQVLLTDMKANTIDWKRNFDGSMDEPIVLPSQLPLSIINGTTGIAVGMASDIPSHNINEIVDACVELLTNKKATLDDVMTHIKGPDLPTGGIINIKEQDLKHLYKTGRGKYKVRARYVTEGDNIVITEIPYQVAMDKCIESIFSVADEKKLFKAISDESDEAHPVRLVLTPKNKTMSPEQIMAFLYSKTMLETTQKFNLNMLGVNGKPETKGIVTILDEWLTYRREILIRQTQFELDKIEARLHVLSGLMVAYLNVDEVIQVIREADEPLAELMSVFELTEIQAQAILDMRLKQLAKLEKFAIEKEMDELNAERDKKNTLLTSPAAMTRHMKNQLRYWQKEFGDERRSTISTDVVLPAQSEALQIEKGPATQVTIAVSKKGWLKSMKGHDVDVTQTRFKDGDGLLTHFKSMSDRVTLMVSKEGRVFNVDNDALPNANTTGEPLVKHVQLAEGDEPFAYLAHEPDMKVLFSTDAGYGFLCDSESLLTRAKKGKECLALYGASALPPLVVNGKSKVALLTQLGKMLIIELDEIKMLSKGKGVKLIGLAQGDKVVGMLPIQDDEPFYIQMSGRKPFKIKKDDIEHYVYPRARKGNFVPVRKATLTGLLNQKEVS